jgi:hypothetical protein
VNDDLRDFIRYDAVNDGGDTVSNFDNNAGSAITDDRVAIGGALRTAWDDGSTDTAFSFVSGNSIGTTVNATVGQANGNAEALLLLSAAGIAATDLNDATIVADAFDLEFNITGAIAGEDAMLVVNAASNTAFAVWSWEQSATGAEIEAAELTLIGVFSSNAAAAGDDFGFV